MFMADGNHDLLYRTTSLYMLVWEQTKVLIIDMVLIFSSREGNEKEEFLRA